MADEDYLTYTNFAKNTCLEAGKILREYYGKLQDSNIEHKGKYDLVTIADKSSEKYIVSKIEKAFPSHGIHGEEFTSKEAESDYTWYLDPLDGTTNFVHQHPFFGISMGLARNNKIVSGVVYVPLLNEMFFATLGKGAFLNEQKINVSKTNVLEKSLLATGFPYKKAEVENNNLGNFSKLLLQVQGIRRCGAAAIDICYVACGRYDGFWELWLEPHDVAAASLIVTEANGKVTNFKGENDYLFSNNIIAANFTIQSILQKQLSF